MDAILKAIKAALKKAGVDEKHAERVQKLFKIEKDEGIDGFVALYKENVIAPQLPEDGVSAEREKAIREKAVAEYEKKYGLKDGSPLNSPGSASGDDEEDAPDLEIEGMDEKTKILLKKQSKDIADLTELVTKLTTSIQKKSTLDAVRTKLKGKIDDDFIDDYIGYVKLDAEDIDAEVARVAKTYTDMHQKFLNKAVASGNYRPANGGVSDTEFDDYVKRTASAESEFEGIKI
ncbi:MAG: hypothetical protein GX102_04610 [Porphyromonadaceae bacterium]|nr:hypothetical protein [Porphyromonadaceae bacterium]